MFDFLLLFILLVFIVTSIMARYIRNKYTYDTGHRYPPINNTHKWVNRILILFIALSVIGAFVFSYAAENYILICIILIIIQNGFSAYMEYKHEREENDYMISLVWMTASLVILVGFMIFTLPTKTVDDVLQDYETFNPELIEQLEIENDAWKEEEMMYSRKTYLEDKKLIDEILSELSQVEVRNSLFGFDKRDSHYGLYIRESEFYYIAVYEDYLSIDFEDYKVVGDNDLYRMLEEIEIDWE
ncbi:DUF4181 domain-containing protein [Ornithinibacillus sp. L9]|uniref:DUF4181 domain-containing protein n=1 Tax=Ornithinibacillus caprae TaxID=2678566 RepID=A0A6N8FGG1_9BACI|nr:DUF4181 domain-containing protein [Ornithinibacillus caprae]MUK87766.1 DUF4181 domain-containing protein [Ornithinibacillus caprae]